MEVTHFAGPNGGYYAAKLDQMFPNGHCTIKPSWNWSAFLVTVFWMVYRKMYIEAVITAVVQAIVFPTIVLVPAVWIACGLLGDSLYLCHIQRALRDSGQASAQTNEETPPHGAGVNTWVTPVAVVLCVLIGLGLFMNLCL